MTDIRHVDVDGGAELARFPQPQPFSVDVRPDRRRVMVVPNGELDIETVGALATEVEDLIARGFTHVVVDLRATSFIDSSGVHLLLEYGRRPDVRITVIDGPPAVSRVFDLAGVREVLSFEAAP